MLQCTKRLHASQPKIILAILCGELGRGGAEASSKSESLSAGFIAMRMTMMAKGQLFVR